MYVNSACRRCIPCDTAGIPKKKLKNKGTMVCFVHDFEHIKGGKYYTFVEYMRFRQFVSRTTMKSFTAFTDTNRVVTMYGNCPIFKYWLADPNKCSIIRSMGYLPSNSSCNYPSNTVLSHFIQAFFARHIHFRSEFLDTIDSILNPIKHALVVDEVGTFHPQLKKYKNLVSIHARFGGKLADFTDSYMFLNTSSTNTFYKCLVSNKYTKGYVYVASDSSACKEELRKQLGEKLVDSSVKAIHSGSELYKDKKEYAKVVNDGTFNAFVDMMVASMASGFVGTELSSFSAMISLLSGSDGIYVGKERTACRHLPVYLP